MLVGEPDKPEIAAGAVVAVCHDHLYRVR
jgi:hypothetical protein